MSRLGNLNGKALRVALCAAEMAGAAAEPIGDVQAIVDSRYDEVAYGGYTRAMVRDELEEEQRNPWAAALAVAAPATRICFPTRGKASTSYSQSSTRTRPATFPKMS